MATNNKTIPRILFIIENIQATSGSGWFYKASIITSTETGRTIIVNDGTHNAAGVIMRLFDTWSVTHCIKSELTRKQYKQWVEYMENEKHYYKQATILNARDLKSLRRVNGKIGAS